MRGKSLHVSAKTVLASCLFSCLLTAVPRGVKDLVQPQYCLSLISTVCLVDACRPDKVYPPAEARHPSLNTIGRYM